MSLEEPAIARMMREFQRLDELLRHNLRTLEGPAEFDRSMAVAVQQGRELERLSQARVLSEALSAQRLALGSTAAFDSLFTAIRRHEQAFDGVWRGTLRSQALYEQSRLAALSTCRIELGFRDWLGPPLDHLQRHFDSLSLTASEVLGALSATPAAFAVLRDWQIQAPTVLPYAAAASLTVLGGVPEEDADLPTELDDALDVVGKRIEDQLRRTSPSLVAPYRGAVHVLTAAGPDWQRHLGASLRTLIDSLLEDLAPPEEVARFLPNPDAFKKDGRFTRRALLMYIFREVAVGGYAKMSENDIEMTLATFYPSNLAVHELISTLDERQGKVLLRRVQGCLATILATRE